MSRTDYEAKVKDYLNNRNFLQETPARSDEEEITTSLTGLNRHVMTGKYGISFDQNRQGLPGFTYKYP